MKNKKIFVGAIGVVIILCSLIFLFGSSSKDIEICQNLSWKDNSDKVEEKLSKLDLVSYEDSSKIEIDEENFMKEQSFLYFQTMGVSSKSPSINLADVPLGGYGIIANYDVNEEIVSVDEGFFISDEYSEEYNYDNDYKVLYNTIVKKFEEKRAKRINSFVATSPDDYLVDVYKTKDNYITINRYNDIAENEAGVTIRYFNPKYSEEDVMGYYKDGQNSRISNDFASN